MPTETVPDRRLHPSTIWLALIRKGLAPWLLPAAVFIVVNLGRDDGLVRILRYLPAAVMVVVIGGGVTVGIAALGWSRFRYGVGERDVAIESGLFTRVRRSIPLARVQDVNIEQGPLARLFGLARVKIETGGGQADEGVLDSVSLDEAERLRHVIRGFARREPDAAAPAVEETAVVPAAGGEVIFSMTPGRVAISGLFSFSLFYLAAAFAVVETLGGVLSFNAFDPRTWRQWAEAASPSAIAWLIVLVVVLGVVAGAGRTFLRDYGFTLWKDGRRFRRQRGLTTRSLVVVPLAKVQLAKVRTSLLRRAFGWFELSLQSLGGAAGAAAEQDKSGRQAIAPFATLAEVEQVLVEAGPYRLPADGALTRVSSRRLFKKLAPLVIPTLALLIVSIFTPPAIFGLVLIGGMAVHGALEWRFYRYHLSDDLLFVANGVWSQKLWIAPNRAGQTISLRRSFLQRLLGLATVIIDTAGATPMDPLQVEDLREATARALVERLRAARRAGPAA